MLSVILPCCNEGRKNIDRAYHVIAGLLRDNNIQYEIIFVNDGSKDDTWQSIQKKTEIDENVKGVQFSRNFGKEAALFAGLTYSKGDCCVTLDCDLQHPPAKIIEMYNLWKEGYEVIEGVKRSRGKESLIHKACAKSFYCLINKATHTDMSKASDFKLLDRKAVNMLLSMPERHMFYRAMSFWVGFKSTEVEFDVDERIDGTTKWSTFSLVKYAIENITSFSTAPMQIVSVMGIVFLLISIIIGTIAIVQYAQGRSLEGFTTVILLLLILGAVLMLSLGIIGYYIAKIYEEIKRRPRFIVDNIVGDKYENK